MSPTLPSSTPNTPRNAMRLLIHFFRTPPCLAFLITPEHAIDKVAKWSPEIFAACQVVLVNKKHIMLEAGVQVSLQPQLSHNRVVMTIYVRIDTVHPLEDLTNH